MVKQINPNGAGVDAQIDFAAPFELASVDQAISAAGGAATLTLSADADRPIILSQIICGYDDTPTGGSLKIEDGSGNTVFGPMPITASGPHVIDFRPPRCGTDNTDLIITLAAGGGTVVGTVWANAYKLY